MAYSLKILDFASILCSRSVLIKGEPSDKKTKIGCFAFLLQSETENILIDTGIKSISEVNTTKSSPDNWRRDAGEYNLADNLSRHGLCCSDISKVLITHTHYDHFSEIASLKNAEIYLNKKEYDFLFSDSHPHAKALNAQREFIKEHGAVLMENTFRINSDITAACLGAHTPGSTAFKVNTDYGSVFLTGDSIFLLESLEKNVPIGFCTNNAEAQNAVKLFRDFNGIVLTSHDLKCKEVIKNV